MSIPRNGNGTHLVQAFKWQNELCCEYCGARGYYQDSEGLWTEAIFCSACGHNDFIEFYDESTPSKLLNRIADLVFDECYRSDDDGVPGTEE